MELSTFLVELFKDVQDLVDARSRELFRSWKPLTSLKNVLVIPSDMDRNTKYLCTKYSDTITESGGRLLLWTFDQVSKDTLEKPSSKPSDSKSPWTDIARNWVENAPKTQREKEFFAANPAALDRVIGIMAGKIRRKGFTLHLNHALMHGTLQRDIIESVYNEAARQPLFHGRLGRSYDPGYPDVMEECGPFPTIKKLSPSAKMLINTPGIMVAPPDYFLDLNKKLYAGIFKNEFHPEYNPYPFRTRKMKLHRNWLKFREGMQDFMAKKPVPQLMMYGTGGDMKGNHKKMLEYYHNKPGIEHSPFTIVFNEGHFSEGNVFKPAPSEFQGMDQEEIMDDMREHFSTRYPGD